MNQKKQSQRKKRDGPRLSYAALKKHSAPSVTITRKPFIFFLFYSAESKFPPGQGSRKCLEMSHIRQETVSQAGKQYTKINYSTRQQQ